MNIYNLSNSATIMPMGIMGEIEKPKASAILQLKLAFRSCSSQKVYCIQCLVEVHITVCVCVCVCVCKTLYIKSYDTLE